MNDNNEGRIKTDVPSSDTQDWRRQISESLKTSDDLWRFLDRLPPATNTKVADPSSIKMLVTPYYAGLINPDDPDDPILKQILPSPNELAYSPSSSLDPLAEEAHSPVKGLVHRYPDRVLLLTTGYCSTLCRFCLRKREWRLESRDINFDIDEVLYYIKSHKEIHDVILSGGDPLFLRSNLLLRILEGVKAIPHVKVVRISSRAPAVLPMRIDKPLLDMLKKVKPIWFLTHFNHPREVTDIARKALIKLVSSGVVVNNQSVLLRGINDSADLLMDLSIKLLEAGVRPYYLHQVDNVNGADHFRVPIEQGKEIIKQMYGRIGGLGVPRYVIDLPGGKGKVPLTPDFLAEKTGNTYIFQGPLGGFAKVRQDGNFDSDRGLC